MKQLFVKTFVLLFISQLYISCIENEFNAKSNMTEHQEKDGYVWYEFTFQGKHGIADEEGNVLTMPKYDIIKYVPNGKFFELRKLKENSKDTLIAIESKEHEKKILLGQGITSYENKTLSHDKGRYYYRTQKPYEDKDKYLYAVYDKMWNEIIPPVKYRLAYMEGEKNSESNTDSKFYPEWYGEGVERFVLVYKYGRYNYDTDIPLSILLSNQGYATILNDDIEYMNLYEVNKVNHDYITNDMTEIIQVGLYPCIIIYTNTVLKESFHEKFEFTLSEDEYKQFRNIHQFQFSNEQLTARKYLSINSEYNIEQYLDENGYLECTYTQQYDNNGDPIIWQIYDELKSEREKYHALLLKLAEQDIDEDAKIWSQMKMSANQHFWNKKITNEDLVEIVKAYKEEHKGELDTLKEKISKLLDPFDIKTKTGRKRIHNLYNNDDNGISQYPGSTFYPQQPTYYGGSGNSTDRNTSTHSNNRRKCNQCTNGRQMVERSINVTTYGIKTNMKTCSECGRTYDSYQWAHFHQQCTTCRGKGYIE